MSVPLGHKNHKSTRNKKLSFIEIYSKNYKIYKNCLALSLDGKSIIRLDPSFRGELNIPEGVETIEHYAFVDCGGVSIIKFPKSFRSFENCSFYGCYAKVLVFRSFPFIPKDLFRFNGPKEIILNSKEDADKLNSQFLDLSCNISVKTDRWTYRRIILNKEVFERGKRDEFGVLYSEDGRILLEFNKKLRSYIIPEGVDTIASSAFRDSRIQKIVMPKSMRIIGPNAFALCESLISIVLNSGLRHVFEGAFNYCENLQSISFPNSLVSIDGFQWCKSLSTVKLPSKIKTIPPYAFSNTNMKQIWIPDTVEKIMDHAFSDSAIENVHLPNSLVYIGKNAFENCRELKRITIPSKVERLSWFLFDGCNNLEEVLFEGELKYVDRGAFRNCTKLKSIKIPNQDVIWFDTFDGCSSLIEITIPSSVQKICKGAFHNCEKLASIYVPKGSEDRFKDMLQKYKDCVKGV